MIFIIGLIVPGNLKYCPYVSYYIDLFKKNKIAFEIISWNKKALKENVDYSYDYSVEDFQMILKTVGYLKFIRFVKRICNKRKYDNVIVFTIAPAVLLSGMLFGKYKNKYYLDIRDDTILRKVIGTKIRKIIDRAKLVVSSSNEFSSWIKRPAVLSHNVDISLVDGVLNNGLNPRIERRSIETHRIMFAGSMLEWPINFEMIKKLKNNNLFSLIFHCPDNDEKQKIVDYCRENKIENVSFFGAYNKEEIYDIYRNQSDWCNIIRAETEVNRNALPNKLYDAMIAGVPVVVLSHNKAICDYVDKYGLGLVFDNIDDLEDHFIDRSINFDFGKFNEGRIDFLTEVLNDYKEFESKITQ